jgi:hypothetical protein
MQRWNYRYNQLLVKSGGITALALTVGSGFHDAMEQFYATKGQRVNVATLQFKEYDVPSLQDITQLNYWNHILPVMVEAYGIYYKGDAIKWTIHEIEREADIQYRGLRLRGKIDLRYSDANGMWILDHKTTSRLNKDVVAGWDFRFQFMFYIWLMSKMEPDMKLKGYGVNAVKKTELRVKQSESLPEFAQRVREDMIINPDKYFYRESYPVTRDSLQHFEETVVNPKIELLQFVIDNPQSPVARAIVENKNTDECQKYGGQPCAYIDLCRHGMDKMGFLYDKKPAKHEELELEVA